MTNDMSCSTTSTLRSNRSRIRRTRSASPWLSWWSAPALGSSSSSSPGCETSARPSSTSFWRRKGNADTTLSRWPARPRKSSTSSARDAEADDLVRPSAGDVAILETDRPAQGLVEPADAVEDRGLPRPVRSDEPDDLAGVHRKVDAVEGDQSSEVDREPRDLEERSAHLTPLPSPSSTIWSTRGAPPRTRAAQRCRTDRTTPAKPR